MKYEKTSYTSPVNILANDHYVGMPYNLSSLGSLASSGVIKAGNVIPANDATAIGILMHDVTLADNPNGTLIIHGFVDTTKATANSSVTVASTALAVLPMIKMM